MQRLVDAATKPQCSHHDDLKQEEMIFVARSRSKHASLCIELNRGCPSMSRVDCHMGSVGRRDSRSSRAPG